MLEQIERAARGGAVRTLHLNGGEPFLERKLLVAIIRASAPLRPTLGMVATQYFLIERTNAAGLLGYMYILEGMPPTSGKVEEYARRAGLPVAALRTILEHAELDPHHIAGMRNALVIDELSANDQELIAANSVGTVQYLTEMYRDLERAAASAAAREDLLTV